MKTISRIALLIVVLAALLALPAPTFAQNGGDGKVVFGGTYALRKGEVLNGSLAVFGGEATLEEGSLVNGDIALSGGMLSINGEVRGNVAILGGSVIIGDTAVIRGDITTLGGSISQSPKAKIEGNVSQGPSNFSFNLPRNIGVPDLRFNFNPFASIAWAIFQAFVLAAIAVVVALLLPNPTRRVAASITGEPLVAGGIGLLSAILLPIVLVLLTITIILIPVTILAVIAAVALFIFGWVALGLELGERMATSLFHTQWTPPVAAGIGTLTLSLISSVAAIIPCIGWLVPFVIGVIGFGGVLASKIGTQIYRRYTLPPAPSAAPAGPMAPVPPSAPSAPVAPVQPVRPEPPAQPEPPIVEPPQPPSDNPEDQSPAPQA